MKWARFVPASLLALAFWAAAQSTSVHAAPPPTPPAAASASSAAPSVSIPFERIKLENGMTVILHVDHSLPMVVVNISYNVGSRFEAPKRSGFAHLFEHLMFMGTRRAPTKAFDAWMEGAGGWNNAWTSEDRTDYYDVGPPTALDLLLWLEADRLRDLGAMMTKEKLDAQREVVKNERRQSTENTPYGKVELRLPELMYPANHPYHHPVIGSHEDLEAAQVDDVKQFFDTYYDPGNASLVVAGDFDKAAVLPIIKDRFASIPSRKKFTDPGAPGFDDQKTTLTSEVRETMEDDVKLGKVILAWQSPKHFGPSDAELDILASVLSQGKASRLYKALVYDKKLAQTVDAVQNSGVLGSRFVVSAIAQKGVDMKTLEAALDEEVNKVIKTPVADEELLRAKNGIETGFVRRLESLRERASLLNLYQAERSDPGYAERDLERYSRATKEGIRDAAAKFLPKNARVVLWVVPKKEKAEEAKPATNKGGAK
jgi:predicted Zn-dependent peptidase